MKHLHKLGIVFMLLLSVVLGLGITFSDYYINTNLADFNLGTYSNTFFNNSNNTLQLNYTQSSGTFTSEIFDSGGRVTWDNLSFTKVGPINEELPNNGAVEEGPYGINMSGNVLLMHFNNDASIGEDSTTIVDVSGGSYNGTVVGAQGQFENAKFNGGYEFVGSNTNDYIVIDRDSVNGLDDFTVSYWAIIDASGQGAVISGAHGGQNNEFLFFTSHSALGLYLQGAVDTWNYNVNDGNWHNFIVTRSGTTAELFLDGVSQGTRSVSTTALNIAVGGFMLGQEQDSVGGGFAASQAFDGKLDELAIWNRVLSDEETQNIYRRGVSNVNVTLRTCDDDLCSGEDFNSTYYEEFNIINESDGRYIQYKTEFISNETNFETAIYNVSIGYTVIDNLTPVISLITPLNDTTNTSSNTPEFIFNATDNFESTLSCDLWLNETTNGTPQIYNSNSSIVSGENSSIISTIPLSDLEYLWWIDCSDGFLNSESEKRLLNISIGDNVSPEVFLEFPVNNTINYTSSTPEFRFNVTDNLASSLACDLYLNQTTNGTLKNYGQEVANVNTSSSIIANETIQNGNYSWYVECFDGSNLASSETRIITLENDLVPPNATLISPINGNGSISFNSLSLTCEAVDDISLNNISVYSNIFGNFELVGTRSINGINTTESFNFNLAQSNKYYDRANSWACEVYDSFGRSSNLTQIENFSSWDLGTHSNTLYNSSTNYLELDNTNSGNYESQVYSGGINTSWDNFTLTSVMKYGEQLPDYKLVETEAQGIDMSNNELLIHFNESSSNGVTLVDRSGSGNDGSVVTNNGGTNKSIEGIIGRGMTFDGAGDYVSADGVSDDINGVDSTSMAWVRSSTSTGQQFALAYNTNGGGNKLLFGHRSGNSALSLFDTSGWQDTGATFVDGDWHHIAFSIDESSGIIEIYLDGNEIMNFSKTATIASNDQFSIGMEYDSATPGDFWNGEIDEVAVFSERLTEEEISKIYQRGIQNINVSFRTCDDSSCSGEPFNYTGEYGYNNLSLPVNDYFQYRINFSTEDLNYFPQIENASIEFSSADIPEKEINKTNVSISKIVESTNSNLYIVHLQLENNYVNETNISVYDFVPQGFVNGSFNRIPNTTLVVNGGEYKGAINIWNVTLSPFETAEINYSVVGTNDYNIRELFGGVGLE